MRTTTRGWAVWMSGALFGCAHVAASTAPLSAPSAPSELVPHEPSSTPNQPPRVATEAAASPQAGSPALAGKSNKRGKRALLQKSCELGSAVACNDLALTFGEDWQQGLPLLERACKLGATRGCANWGVFLWRSASSDRDRDHALELLDRACEAADDFACAELGDALYTSGETQGPHFFGKAHAAYEKGCKLGSVLSCLSDGWMLRRGEGAPKDPRRARELFRLACERESYAGCGALGYDLTDDAKNGEELAEGARLLKLACEHNEAFACFSLGAQMLTSGDPRAVGSGLELVKHSCKLGLDNACRYANAVEAQLKSGEMPAPGGSDDAEADED